MCANVKKKIRFSLQGEYTQLVEIEVQRVLPNEFAQAIGPYIFIEHFLSRKELPNNIHKGLVDSRSKPLRGIATLTYILSGEVEHLDSIGNHVKLGSGGVHLTCAGRGIVHNEAIRSENRKTNKNISVVRFWVNLPSKRKSDDPFYFFIRSDEIPKKELDGIAGWIKILSGEYENKHSKVPCYSKEFLYHIHLEAGKQFSISTNKAFDYAAFLPSNKAVINDIEFQAGDLVAFTSYGEIIELYNSCETVIDIILFGGEVYGEPIVAEGAFVMNTPHEITQAYNDFYDGKYGQITEHEIN
jgi:redox-sensitive bicupin YhaK (pirin superfamily)